MNLFLRYLFVLKIHTNVNKTQTRTEHTTDIPTKGVVGCRVVFRPAILTESLSGHGTSYPPPIPGFSGDLNLVIYIYGADKCTAFLLVAAWRPSVDSCLIREASRQQQVVILLRLVVRAFSVEVCTSNLGAAVVEIGRNSKDTKRHNNTNPNRMFAVYLPTARSPLKHPQPSNINQVRNGGCLCAGCSRPRAYPTRNYTRVDFLYSKVWASITQSRTIAGFVRLVRRRAGPWLHHW